MMKHKLFVLISLPLVILASACGKSNDQPVATTAAVQAAPANSCPSGQVYNATYGCGQAYYGQPSGYNGQPVNVTIPTNNYCSGGYGTYYGGGNACWNQGYSYHWSYYAGYYYYW